MKGFSGFGNSPAKAATDPTKGMSAEQKAMWEKNRKDYEGSSQAIEDKLNANLRKIAGEKTDFEKELEKRKIKKSPAKQQGPTPEKNPDLMKGEMEGTWVYKGKNKNERIIDLEDRAEFARSDAESAEGEEKNKHLANAKKLQHEADILRNRKPNKK